VRGQAGASEVAARGFDPFDLCGNGEGLGFVATHDAGSFDEEKHPGKEGEGIVGLEGDSGVNLLFAAAGETYGADLVGAAGGFAQNLGEVEMVVRILRVEDNGLFGMFDGGGFAVKGPVYAGLLSEDSAVQVFMSARARFQ